MGTALQPVNSSSESGGPAGDGRDAGDSGGGAADGRRSFVRAGFDGFEDGHGVIPYRWTVERIGPCGFTVNPLEGGMPAGARRDTRRRRLVNT